MSVNKLLTFINHNCDRRKEDNSSLDETDKSIIFIKLTVGCILPTSVAISTGGGGAGWCLPLGPDLSHF